MSLSHISFLKSVQYAVFQFLLILPMRKRKKKWKIEGFGQNRWLHPSLLSSENIWIIMKAFIFSAFILYPSPSWKSYIRLVRVMKNAAWIMKAEQCPILPYIHKVNRGIIFSLLILICFGYCLTINRLTKIQKCFIYQYLYKFEAKKTTQKSKKV